MNSKSTINLVILFLGLIALTVVVGGFVLAVQDRTIPTELIGLGATALGAVAGILAKTGTEPIPVVAAPAAEVVEAQAVTPPPAAPSNVFYADGGFTPPADATDDELTGGALE